jgi:predicted O-methyltransferase YrrM
LEVDVQDILFNAARLVTDGIVAEIGSYKGLSTAHLAAGRKLAVSQLVAGSAYPDPQEWAVLAIDPFCDAGDKGGTNNFNNFYPEFIANMTKAGVLDYITPIVSKSAEAAAKIENDSIEVLFVDGDHTYEGVRADFDNYFPKMQVGGLMAFHDTGFPGPGQLMQELDKDTRLSFVLQQNSMRMFRKESE